MIAYQQKTDSRFHEENGEIILETTDPTDSNLYYKKLYIDKKTQKPTKIIINNSTGKEVINIKYTDIVFIQ